MTRSCSISRVALLLMLASCGGGDAGSKPEPPTSPLPQAPAAVASVAVALGAASIEVASTTTASATVRDANGNTLTGRSISWSSTNAATATVDAGGAVRAVAPGTTTITATVEGVIGAASLTVVAAPVEDFHVGAIQASIRQISALKGADANARRQEMLTYLRNRSEFEAAGEDDDGSVWARFTDGRLFIIIANRDAIQSGAMPVVSTATSRSVTPAAHSTFRSMALPAPLLAESWSNSVSEIFRTENPFRPATLTARLTPGPPAELPVSLQSRFFLGGEPQTYPTVIAQLKAMVARRNYTLAPNAGIGGLDDLKRVSGDGIFYWTSHGGGGQRRDGSIAYGVATATEISLVNDLLYKQDWDSLRLVYTVGISRTFLPSIGSGNGYYAITSEFVRKYMRFAQHSLVYLGACSAAYKSNIGFIDALKFSGAGVVVAWDSAFSTTKDYEAAQYVFDRMLGLNEFRPETPAQRPFDYADIKRTMAPYDRELSAELKFFPGSNGPSGLLAPSIQTMYMDEVAGAVVLTGKFGTAAGRAEVGGRSRPLRSWSAEKIEIDVPVSGPGSSGEVVVYSQERRSNVRPLTDWRSDFRWSFVEGHGTLQFNGHIRAHFRADVHNFRELPGRPPIDSMVSFRCASDTDGDVIASGVDPTTGPVNTRWTGTATLSNRIVSPSGQNLIDCMGEIDTDRRQLRLFLFASAQSGLSIISQGITIGFPAVWAYGDGTLLGPNPLPAMIIPLTQNFSIPAGFRRQAPTNPSQRLDWDTTVPAGLPADSMARVRAIR